MSILKYLEERDAEDDRPVARTLEGYPIRNQNVPLLKRHEMEEVELSADARVRQFETDNVEHMRDYQEILDRVANGLFFRLAEDRELPLPPPRLGWVILVRYAEVKGDVPPRYLQTGGQQ